MPRTRRLVLPRVHPGVVSGAGGLVALLALAVNQRPAVAAIGPVLDEIRRSLPLSSTAASVLTAAPVVCFGVFAAAGRRLERVLGMRAAITVFAAVLVVGLLVRQGPDAATLFVGTILAAAGIAAMNVLLPAMVRLDHPERTGLWMGIYTTGLTGAAAVAAGVTVPLQHALGGGWRTGLAPWVILAGVGLLIWLPMLHGPRVLEDSSVFRGAARPHRDPPAAGHERSATRELWRDRIAWMVTAYFGLQSAGFYAVLTYLPSLYEDHGLSATHAGALLSLSAIVQTPVALVTPALATRWGRQGPLVAISCGLTAVGFLLLLLAPVAAAYPAVVILGIGQGMAFPLALTVMVLRAPTVESTTRLSSMSQTTGYLFASLGPLLVGLLHAATGGWTVPLLLLLALVVPQLASGLIAGEPRDRPGTPPGTPQLPD